MLLQTNIIQNMLIDEGPSYQNLLIPTTTPSVIDDTVIDDSGGAPVTDDGLGGGRGALSIDNTDIFVHFDAKRITTDDYDPITNNLLSVKNLANNEDFVMWGEPKFEYNALSGRLGNIHCDLPGALQLLYPDDFHFSVLVVFSNNVGIETIGHPVLCQTQPQYGNAYANLLTITGYGNGLDLKVNRLMRMDNRTDPNIINEDKFIVFADYKYTKSTNTHTRQLRIYSVNGDLITDDTLETTGPMTKPTWRDEWFTIGGTDSNRNFTRWLIYEVIFTKRGFTNTEISDQITYLSEKWNN